MDDPTLMHQLMEIERALGRHDECAVRNLILQAQDAVLALERENETLALENAGLRQRLDAARNATLPYAAHAPVYSSSETPSPAAPPLENLRRKIFSAVHGPEPDTTNGGSSDKDSRPSHTWRTTHFFFS